MPSLGGATGWVNSEPLSPAELRGHVVLVNFWTLDLHQLAAPGALRPRVVAGVPSRRVGRHRRPHAGVRLRARVDSVRKATERARDRLPGRGRQRLRDLDGRSTTVLAGALFRRRQRCVRHHHFGEGGYEESERVIQELLGVERELVSVQGVGGRGGGRLGRSLRTPETYLGSAGGAGKRTREGRVDARRRVDGRAGEDRARSRRTGASAVVSTRVTLTSCCPPRGASRPRSACSSMVSPGSLRMASTSTSQGTASSGKAACTRSCASTAQSRERTVEITFREPGAEAYAFTFG